MERILGNAIKNPLVPKRHIFHFYAPSHMLPREA